MTVMTQTLPPNKDPFDSRRERSPQTVTSKASTGTSTRFYQSRPRTVAFSRAGNDRDDPDAPARLNTALLIYHRPLLLLRLRKRRLHPINTFLSLKLSPSCF